MKEIRGKIDKNDLAFITERYGLPVSGLPCPIIEGKINPHVSRFLLQNGEIIDLFHVKPIYYQHLNETWRPLGEVLEYHGNKKMTLRPDWDKHMSLTFLRWLMRRQKLLETDLLIPSPYQSSLIPLRENREIFFTTDTFFPDPNTESTSVDGWCGRGDLGAGAENWATIRSGTGIESGDSDATADALFINNFGATTTFKENRRGITLFDTSAIDNAAVISVATLSVKPSAVSNHHGGALSMGVVAVVPTSNTAIANTDYNIAKWTFTRQASDKTLASLSAGTYADYSLNATGISNVSLTGITKFGWALSSDIDNADPGLDASFTTGVTFNFADQTGTTSDPKLVVTYTIGAISGGSFLLNFI